MLCIFRRAGGWTARAVAFPTGGCSNMAANTNIDPYALCPSGDGWTILQAFQNGWNPDLFYTPPPPQNVQRTSGQHGDHVIITWESGGGPVTNYGCHGSTTWDLQLHWPSWSVHLYSHG